MTEQEYQLIVGIGDSLRAQPTSWNDLPEEHKATVINILQPKPSFSQEQRDFLNRWWMQVTDEQLATMNAKMPPHNVISGRVGIDGNKYISADLFTDAVLPGARLAAILDDMLALTLTYKTDEDWPEPEEPE